MYEYMSNLQMSSMYSFWNFDLVTSVNNWWLRFITITTLKLVTYITSQWKTEPLPWFPLQLMKATMLAESSSNLFTFIVICLFQQCLQTVVRQVSLSFLHFKICFIILPWFQSLEVLVKFIFLHSEIITIIL